MSLSELLPDPAFLSEPFLLLLERLALSRLVRVDVLLPLLLKMLLALSVFLYPAAASAVAEGLLLVVLPDQLREENPPE